MRLLADESCDFAIVLLMPHVPEAVAENSARTYDRFSVALPRKLFLEIT
jgi:hypothetical protein